MTHRDINLVIKDEEQMSVLLKFLIYRMKSVDGSRNSAVPYLEALNKQSLKAFKELNGYETIKKSKEVKILQENEHFIANRVFLKYKIMKIRAKISYMAFEKRMTIAELFLEAILKSFNQ